MATIQATADALARILARHGVGVVVRRSGLSSSHYIEADGIRIRVSGHVARPSYEALNGAAHVEVGTHDMASTASATRAAARVLGDLDVPHDRYLRAALAAAAAKAAREATARQISEAAIADRAAAQGTVMETFLAWAGARWEAAAQVEGARARKRARQALKAAFRAAHPQFAEMI